MKNKGFTLVELLAVIVLLTVLLLIATPRVLGAINKSRIKSAKISKDSFLHTIDLKLNQDSYVNTEKNLKNGYYEVSDLENYGIKFSGGKPTAGWIAIEKGEVKYYSIVINNRYVFTKDYFSETMTNGDTPIDRIIYTYLYRNSDVMTANNQTIAASIPGQQQYYVCDYDKHSMSDCGIYFSTLKKCQDFIDAMSTFEDSIPDDTCVLKDYITPELNTTLNYSEYENYSPYIRNIVDSNGIINYTSLCVNFPSGQLCVDNDSYTNLVKKINEYVKFDKNTWTKDSSSTDEIELYINKDRTIAVAINKDGNSYVFYDNNHEPLFNINTTNYGGLDKFIDVSFSEPSGNESGSSKQECEMYNMGSGWFSFCMSN